MIDLRLGDCMELLPEIPDGSVGFMEWVKRWFTIIEIKSILRGVFLI